MFNPLDDHDPRQVGPYALRARIGAGGMGRVYLAYTPGGRALAVKVVRAELAEDAEFRARFRQEVEAARRVRGAFTAELIDADTEGPLPWLATLYVPGLSLQQAVTEHGPLPVPTVWQLLAGMAEALRAIHSAGVIHRDLKPANVLLAPDGPRVIDFGIARATDTTPVTRTGIRVGSPQFMAPEHALGEDLTGAADVFSFGALAVYAVTGTSPFGEGPDAAVLYRVVNEAPVLDRVDDPRLRELAGRCLSKRPDQRPSLADILQECATVARQIQDGWLPEAVARAETMPPSPPAAAGPADRTGTGRHRKPVVVMPILVFAILVAAVVLTGGLGGNSHDNSQGRNHGNGSPYPQSPSVGRTFVSSSDPDEPVTMPPTVETQAPPPPVDPQPRQAQPPASHPPVAQNHAVAAPTPAYLGAPNWNGYCEATGQGSAQLIRNDAYGWQCSAADATGDDANAVCAWTYGTDQITNRVSNFNDPTTWQCWRATHQLGPLNFSAYCQDIGYPGAYQDGSDNAYGWHCTDNQNGIDSQDACLRLYGSAPAISRFQDFYDPNSWQCWG